MRAAGFPSLYDQLCGPLRKDDNNQQIAAMTLTNVCYKVYARAEEAARAPGRNNHLHALQEIFQRRLHQGQFYTTPYLGWREFVPSYFGELRPCTHPLEEMDFTIPSMLYSIFEKPGSKKVAPIFRCSVEVRKGVLYYDE